MSSRESDVAVEQRPDSPADINAQGWWATAKQTWREGARHNLGLLAAGIAFNAFLAMVPLLTAVVLTYGLVASPEQVAQHITELARTLPQDAASLIARQLKAMVQTAGTTAGFGLGVALAIALYGALRGATGAITGLNIAYNVEEKRSFLGQTAVALAITAGAVVALILASAGISVLNMLDDLVPSAGRALHTLLQIGFWALATGMLSIIIAAIYAYAPSRDRMEWRWITPGSAIATLVWIAATAAFSFYVSNFGSYNATYGALGAVIVFLTWLYLSSYILLLGAELNQVLARRAGKPSRA